MYVYIPKPGINIYIFIPGLGCCTAETNTPIVKQLSSS